MAFTGDINQRQKDSFVDEGGLPARRVKVVNIDGLTFDVDVKSDAIATGGLNGSFTVTATAKPLMVGVANLADRRLVNITVDNGDIWWGYSATTTSLTGFKLKKNDKIDWLLDDDVVNIYVVVGSGTKVITVGEAILG